MQTIALRQDPPSVELPGTRPPLRRRAIARGPITSYTITQSGGRLYGATNGGKPVEIKAELADVLFTPGQPRTRKIFQRDAAGKVTGFREPPRGARRGVHEGEVARVSGCRWTYPLAI